MRDPDSGCREWLDPPFRPGIVIYCCAFDLERVYEAPQRISVSPGHPLSFSSKRGIGKTWVPRSHC